MKKAFPFDFFYALTTLLLSFTLVHVAYTLVIRPNAEIALVHQREVWARDPLTSVPRSIWVIMHDPEPETCWVLAVWAGFILGYREYRVVRERKLLQQDLLGSRKARLSFRIQCANSRARSKPCRPQYRRVCCRAPCASR